MSIIRVGLAETKDFADGYDAIFGGKKTAAPSEEAGSTKKPKKTKAKAVKKAVKTPGVKKKATKKPAK